MRSLQIRQGFRTARAVHREGRSLIRSAPLPTLLLGIVLAVLPALLKGFFTIQRQSDLHTLWTYTLDSLFAGTPANGTVTGMVQVTLAQSGRIGIWALLTDAARSLVLTPMLLTSLALVYNGYAGNDANGIKTALQKTAANVRNLIIVALVCLLAQWIVQMLPSIVSGFLNLLTEMLAWIPILGPIAAILSVILSVLVTLATDFAVVVIFCYVWICVACENASGFGALVRSWQLTRNAMRETIFSLLWLVVLRALAVLVAALLCIAGYWLASVPLIVFLYVVYAISGLFTAYTAAITSALYHRRPHTGSPWTGRFQNRKDNVVNMKRANID